jgi:HEPN domain-containing protein
LNSTQNNNNRPPSFPEEWLRHAVSDLNLARIGRDTGDILNVHICFHAQQAVEKAFKAILTSSKIDFTLTHDLDELAYIIKTAGISLPADISEPGSLTPYAEEAQGNGYWADIPAQDVENAIRIAKRVLT